VVAEAEWETAEAEREAVKYEGDIAAAEDETVGVAGKNAEEGTETAGIKGGTADGVMNSNDCPAILCELTNQMLHYRYRYIPVT
jgi:hypothetical protein